MSNLNYSDEELYRLINLATAEFYELVYKDFWFKEIFKVIDQKVITSQQTDFMVQAFGGAKKYGGRSVLDAHPHIFINEEIWQKREELLKEAFRKMNTPMDIQEKWLKIDDAFKRSIMKNSIDDCKKRYATDEIIYVPNPIKKAA
jgi:hemoglobin